MHDLIYANAREHERQLLQLAQKHRFGTVPVRERQRRGYGGRLFGLIRRPALPPQATRSTA